MSENGALGYTAIPYDSYKGTVKNESSIVILVPDTLSKENAIKFLCNWRVKLPVDE